MYNTSDWQGVPEIFGPEAMGVVTLILIVVAYFATRKLGTNITRLNNFAKKAERGERIYADESFPDDELGEISSHIDRKSVV